MPEFFAPRLDAGRRRADAMTRIGIPTAAALGLATIVGGTFLPWLHSGSATRNSYRAGAVARRVLHVPQWWSGALVVWPFVGVLCAVGIALYVFELVRAGAVVGLIIGVGTVAVAIAAMAIRANGTVSPAATGPIVTIIGGCVAIIASSVLLRSSHHPHARS